MDISKISDTEVSVPVDAVKVSLTELKNQLVMAQKQHSSLLIQINKTAEKITKLQTNIADAVKLGVKEDPKVDFSVLRNLKKGDTDEEGNAKL